MMTQTNITEVSQYFTALNKNNKIKHQQYLVHSVIY